MKKIGNSIDFNFTFHNVGQGLFYSGFIGSDKSSMNFIFDCGTNSKKIYLTNSIDDYYSNYLDGTKEVDILVISHFDNDHVNGLDYLAKKQINIKNIVIPYIQKTERMLLLAKSRYISKSYGEFLNNPAQTLFEKFGSNVIVIVDNNDQSTGDNIDLNNIENIPEIDEKLKKIIMGNEGYSMTQSEKLKFTKSGILFNYKNLWGFQILFNSILSASFSNFENCVNSIFPKNVDLKNIILNKVERNKLKNCYRNSIAKDLNYTSLSLLHAPIPSVKYINLSANSKKTIISSIIGIVANSNRFPRNMVNNGCSFGHFMTGDIPLKGNQQYFTDIQKIKRKDQVSILQIPHHGSIRTWDKIILSEFKNLKICCISSRGIPTPKSNIINSKSQVIMDIWQNSNYALWSNETQKIEFKGKLAY